MNAHPDGLEGFINSVPVHQISVSILIGDRRLVTRHHRDRVSGILVYIKNSFHSLCLYISL